MIINGNKHLVSVGHELAATMTADTPIIEIAKLVTRLATALDVQTALVGQLTSQRDVVVAENAGLKNAAKETLAHWAAAELGEMEVMMDKCMPGLRVAYCETSATNAAIAALRAEGAHFVANRMLAAWEAGFIDDTAKNAADIARMILTSTEFMAEAPVGDFDRSFADGVLDDIARQLRESKGEVQS